MSRRADCDPQGYAREQVAFNDGGRKVPDAPQLEATGLPVERVPWL